MSRNNSQDGKMALLVALTGMFLYLTFSKSGRKLAASTGEYIMDLSDSALNVIKQFEGFSPKPYPDAQGFSIGYGHFIKPGESFTTITRDQAASLLRHDASIAAEAVKRLVKVPLNQNQFDALTSFVYNVGAEAFKNSTMLKKLNAGNYSEAAEQFSIWNKATIPGQGKTIIAALVDRRSNERDLFLSA